MDTLHLLEDKILLLVSHIKRLQDERENLIKEQSALQKTHDSITSELSSALQDNKKLQAKLNDLQKASVNESKEREFLSNEREQALLAVDNLIKSIDGLIASEVSQ